MSTSSTVVLVGHCGPDSFMLRTAVGRFLPGAPIVMVNDAASLTEHLTPDRVLLVNRVLDGRFESDSGIELISNVAGRPGGPRCLLISNFDDAQAQAASAGALPGFGKSDLYSDKAAERLRAAATDSCEGHAAN